MRTSLASALIVLASTPVAGGQSPPRQETPNAALLRITEQLAADPRDVREQLARGADPNAAPSAGGQPPLLASVRYANLGAMRLLLAAGADVNGRANGETALCIAVGSSYGRQEDMVVMLLAKRADPNLACSYPGSPLRKALIYKLDDVAGILIAAGARVNDGIVEGDTVLTTAARHGSARLVEQVLARGAGVNEKARYGWTALMSARTVSIAAVLIKRGADVNARSEKGETALTVHEARGAANIVALLREHGAR